MKMKCSKLLIASVVIAIGTMVLPTMAKQTYRDAKGVGQWTAQAEGAKIVYRNAEGKVGGSAQKAPNGKVTYRAKDGKVKGSAQIDGSGTTTYRNAQGNVAYVVQGEKTIADMGFIAFKLFE